MLGRAKDIIVRPISAKDGRRIIRQLHYSGRVVNNSQIHLGVFLDGRCGGALQFGPSMDKRNIQGLVADTKWHEFIELNRMAMADWLPRNGESRVLSVAVRLFRQSYPQVKWLVSFADGCQCGDGTIYRAAGFVLTGIRKNDQVWAAPSGEVFDSLSLRDGESRRRQAGAGAIVSRMTKTKGGNICQNGASSMSQYKQAGWKPLPGFQLRYIYFLDPAWKERLTVPILPFSAIQEAGAGMYKGKPCVRSDTSDTSAVQAEEGGATPTLTL